MTTMALTTTRRRKLGLTLIELIVVVLILGILAAVALPKFIGQSDSAKLNGSLQSLSVLRGAIDTYRVQNTAYPTAANLPTALAPHLRSPTFPAPSIGTNAGNNTIANCTTSPLTVVAGGAGWCYNATTGEIGINDASYLTY